MIAVDDGAPLHAWAGSLQRVPVAVWFNCIVVTSTKLWRTNSQRELERVGAEQILDVSH